jgi:hypothetical protein
MRIIQIDNWYGRFGNNILQLVYSIVIAIDKKYNKIVFPRHAYFNKQEIIINDEHILESHKLTGCFYPFNHKDKPKFKFSRIKYIFKKYIEEILIFKRQDVNITDQDIVLHIRSGDIFQFDAFGYLQPPVYFYKTVLNDYSAKRIIVSEDCLNPCINWLIQNENCKRVQNSNLINDINIIINAHNVCFGFGTFGIFMLLMNDKAQNVYFPDYSYNKIINSWNVEFDSDFKVHVIELPDYIENGKWFRTKENLATMINYTPHAKQ